MATKRKTTMAEGGAKQHSRYKSYRKKVMWIEILCTFLIWVLFIVGLGLVFYLRAPAEVFDTATAIVIVGILFLSIVPFLANWEYYSSIWKAWREGKEIIYKEERENNPYAILGSREVWIKE